MKTFKQSEISLFLAGLLLASSCYDFDGENFTMAVIGLFLGVVNVVVWLIAREIESESK